MRQDISVEMFKGRMKGYRYFQRQILRLEDEIQECYNQLGASPKSPNLQSEPIHSPKNIDKEYQIRDKIEILEGKKARCKAEIDFCEQILGEIETPVKEAIIDVYGDRKTLQSQSQKLYMAKSTLQDKIDKAIKEAIRKTL